MVKRLIKILDQVQEKWNNILRSIRGLKAEIALRNLRSQRKELQMRFQKQLNHWYLMRKITINWILIILFVKEAYVGKGITLKRFRPRARGRAAGIKNNLAI